MESMAFEGGTPMDTKSEDMIPDSPVESSQPHLHAAVGRTPRPVISAKELRPEGYVYAANREALLRDHEGEWVVILGDEILGTWPTEEEAMDAGIAKYGAVSFMCRQITAEPDPVIYYAHDLP
jgi:hypothetical protein